MKKILIIFLLMMPLLVIGQVSVCFNEIGLTPSDINGNRSVYVKVSYNCRTRFNYNLSLSLTLSVGGQRPLIALPVSLLGIGTTTLSNITSIYDPNNTISIPTATIGYVSFTTNKQFIFINGACTGLDGCCITEQVFECNLSTTYTTVAFTCGESGHINLYPTGGSPPYTYTWSHGVVTNYSDIDLPAGTFSVVITDKGGGCSRVISNIVILDYCTPCNLSVTATTKPVSCVALGSASITATGGRLLPYTYLWSNGATTSTINAASGDYSVTVSDASRGCSVVKNNIIIGDNRLYLTPSSQPRACGAPNGVASVLINGGTSPYSYRWSTGATTSSIAGPPGIYNVQVTDGLGCSSTVNVSIQDGCICNLSLFATKGAESGCPNNTMAEYLFVLQGMSKGSPPFNYRLTNTSLNSTFTPLVLNNSASTAIIWTIPPGKYLIEVEDAIHCKKSLSFEYINNCPVDCKPQIDNCRTEWQQFLLKNYANGQCKAKIWETDCNTTSSIRRNGKVAIGLNLKTVPDGFNLAVQGGVIANEVKVKLCTFDSWCDYVFDNKYQLMPLLDVNSYIQQNKKLPNMPSTADIVNEGGYEIKKLTLLQLEKIEEAYLHLIKLEQKIKDEQTKIEVKKQRNNKIAHLIK